MEFSCLVWDKRAAIDVARQSWYFRSGSGCGRLGCRAGMGFICDKFVDDLVGELGETSWSGATSAGMLV